jgi:hypothetical protein
MLGRPHHSRCAMLLLLCLLCAAEVIAGPPPDLAGFFVFELSSKAPVR